MAHGAGMDLRNQSATNSLHCESRGLKGEMASENAEYFFYHTLDKYRVVYLLLKLGEDSIDQTSSIKNID